MFRNYHVVFLSDVTATAWLRDRGFGPMPNAEIHHATLGHTCCVNRARDVGGGYERASSGRRWLKRCALASSLNIRRRAIA